MAIDIWYKDERENINGIDWSWSDCDCVYRGNLYANGRVVGDYSAKCWEVVDSIAKGFNIDLSL